MAKIFPTGYLFFVLFTLLNNFMIYFTCNMDPTSLNFYKKFN